jgi:hypothetical protein
MTAARYIAVTHQSAEIEDAAQRRSTEAAAAEHDRAQRDRAQAETWREIDSPAVRRFAARGAVGVNPDGSVKQTFACHCGKHSHRHGEPEHADGFSQITQATRFESPEPSWSSRARENEERKERARALAKRVEAASHPQTPSAAGAALSPTPGRGPKLVRTTIKKDQTR